MSELPTGWMQSRLGELADFVMGQAPNAKDCNTHGVGTIFVKAGEFGRINPIVREWTTHPLKYAKEGDILICVVGATAGKINLGIDCSIGRSVAAVRPTNEISQKFIYYFLASKIMSLRQGSTGSAQGVISKPDLAAITIPMAPASEQTRIAAKLDELLAQVDTLKARIDGIPALLKRFRQSVLSAAVSGRLTEEWREQKDFCNAPVLNSKAKSLGIDELASAEELLGEPLPCFWSKYALDQLVDAERGIPYGIVQTGSAVENGIPTVRCGDVKKLYIDTSNLKPVSSEIECDYKRTRLKGGEVLLAIRGSVGNAGVTPKALHGCNISREVAMIPTLPSVLPFYLACLLQSPFGQRLLVGKVRGVAQKGINLADVRRLPVALPPYEEQTEIVRRVEQLFAFADQLEARIKASQARIDRLTQSILAKAFRGELVPQDPNDEPASVLLERIKAERATAPKAKRGRGAAKLS